MTDRQEQHTALAPEHDEHVPDVVLERCRLGEIPSRERDAFARRLEADPRLRARLAALERSDEELHRRLDTAQLAARVRARLASRREHDNTPARGWARVWPLPAGLAVAATVAFVVVLRTTEPHPPLADPSAAPASLAPSEPMIPPAADPPPPTAASAGPTPHAPSAAAASPLSPGEPGVRLKGLRPALSLFRKTANGSETLADGDIAREGDLIRIGYHAVGRRYGVIVSLDGRGGVTRHLPESGATAALLQAREVVLLAHAYQLDDAPAWERFFFVTADGPFPVATVEGAARQVAGATGQAPVGLPLPQPLEQSTFLLTKE